MKVIFAYPKNGRPTSRSRSVRTLKKGKTYTVEDCFYSGGGGCGVMFRIKGKGVFPRSHFKVVKDNDLDYPLAA